MFLALIIIIDCKVKKQEGEGVKDETDNKYLYDG